MEAADNGVENGVHRFVYAMMSVSVVLIEQKNGISNRVVLRVFTESRKAWC